MCRRNQLLGWVQLAFGLGLLVGKCLESGFFATVLGVVLIWLGFSCMRRR